MPGDVVAFALQQRRDRGTVHAARHRDGNQISHDMLTLYRPARQAKSAADEPTLATTASIKPSTCSAVLSGPQRKAHARSRFFRRQSHREQNVRRLDGAARTCRAARNRIAAQIERDHHRLALDAVEPDIGCVRQRGLGRAIDARAGTRAQDAAVPAGRAAPRVPLQSKPSDAARAQSAAAPAHFRCPRGDRAHDGRHGTSAASVDSLAHVQRADAFRSAEFMAADGIQIDAEFAHIHGKPAADLHAIGVEYGTRPAAPLRRSRAIGCSTPVSLFACMIVISAVAGRSARRTSSDQHNAVAADRQIGDFGAFALQLRAGIQHGGMLDRAGDHMPRRAASARRATPKMARLSDSVPPLVKTISRASQPRSRRDCPAGASRRCLAA